MTLRSHTEPEARGGSWEEPSTPEARAHGATRGAVAAQTQEGLEELSHVEGQERWQYGVPLLQGKEQWLCFAGAAVKRYPMSKVRETQVRW